MKKRHLIMGFILASLLTFKFLSCTSSQDSITANIDGLGDDTVYVIYGSLSNFNTYFDTIIAKEGKFVYTPPLQDTFIVMLQPKQLVTLRYNGYQYFADPRYINLVLTPNQKNKITGKIETDYIDYKTKGEPFNEAYSGHRSDYKQEDMKADSIEMVIDYYNSIPQSAKNDSIIELLFNERNKEFQKIRQIKLEYLQKHPESELSAYYLSRFPVSVFEENSAFLAESARNGIFKKELNDRYKEAERYKRMNENNKRMIEGATAPDFVLKDLHGKDFRLSDQKGKYIVLDFWGSWCGWCIKGFPEMKTYYTKYKDKVEFISISCRDTDAKWKKAVEENDLKWRQLINNESEGLDKDLPTLYALEGYPTKIILDKELKIVLITVGESPDFYKKLDDLLK